MFAPEHFARVRQVDTMKRKQFVKGINQICSGGRDPDLSGIQYRDGRDHCRRGRCAAV